MQWALPQTTKELQMYDTSSTTPVQTSESPDAIAVDLGHELTQGFAARFIRHKCRQLVGQLGLTRSDRDDLEQDMRMALIERFEQFDSAVAHWNVFVTTIVEHAVVAILEHRGAEKRGHGLGIATLHTLVNDGEGGYTELAQCVLDDERSNMTGFVPRDPQEVFELSEDLSTVLDRLPPDLREMCERLKTMSITELAREMDVPRRTLRDRLESVRHALRGAGFGENVRKSPPSPARNL